MPRSPSPSPSLPALALALFLASAAAPCHGVETTALTQSRAVVPLLADGAVHPILELDLVLAEPRTLTAAEFSLGEAPGDLHQLLVTTADGTPFGTVARAENRITATGSMDLPAGRHRLHLRGALRKGSALLQSIAPHCAHLEFAGRDRLAPDPAGLPPLRPAYPVHRRGDFNCHTFRIPGLARANDGTLLAVFDMRYNSSRDLQEHIDIGLSRSTDQGRTWSDPVPIMDMGEFGGKPQKENGCSDPGILVDRETGEIHVFALWSHGKPGTHQWHGTGSEPGHDLHRSSQFMMVRSSDHGETWSAPENLTTKLKDPSWYLFAPAPGNGITLRDGTLVLPSQGRDAAGRPFSNLTWSKDRGETWTVSAPARDDTTESAVAELSDGSLLLNMRDNRNRGDKSDTNGRALAVTRDLGASWSVHPADHGALPEPVCMGSMISHTLPDGRHLLLFSNPRDKEARRNMTIQVSFDDGKTWPPEHHLLLDSGTGFGYSSMALIDDQTLGILYESSQADMTFQAIPLIDLLGPKTP